MKFNLSFLCPSGFWMLFIRQIYLFSTVETLLPVVMLEQVRKMNFSEHSPTLCMSKLCVVVAVRILEHYLFKFDQSTVSSRCYFHAITSWFSTSWNVKNFLWVPWRNISWPDYMTLLCQQQTRWCTLQWCYQTSDLLLVTRCYQLSWPSWSVPTPKPQEVYIWSQTRYRLT